MKTGIETFSSKNRSQGTTKNSPMRTSLFFAGALLLSLQVIAQHPLVGTWEMVSITGVNVDGKKFSLDTLSIREIKVITPTHYMLIAQDVRGDSLVFNRSYVGKVQCDGNKYLEIPLQSSLQIFEGVKTDFTWKVEGDIFTQAGTITRPDGKKIVLDALKFKRVKAKDAYPNNPAIGTWSQLSSSFTLADGTKGSHTRETTTRFQIITPTHWMRISHSNNKFERADGGTYTMHNSKSYPDVDVSSQPVKGEFELTEKVVDDRLTVKGKMNLPDGKVITWDDVFERLPK